MGRQNANTGAVARDRREQYSEGIQTPDPGNPLAIGTRGPPLAAAQAIETRSLLMAAHGLPEAAFEIAVIKTTADRVQDRALSEIGGKGLFYQGTGRGLVEPDDRHRRPLRQGYAHPAAGRAGAGLLHEAGRPARRIQAELDFAISDNATLGLSYSGQFGGRATDNGAKANLNVRF